MTKVKFQWNMVVCCFTFGHWLNTRYSDFDYYDHYDDYYNFCHQNSGLSLTHTHAHKSTCLCVYQLEGEVQPSARWTLGVITMNHLACGGQSSVNGSTMTLLGQSREPLRQQMATWTRHNFIQVAESSGWGKWPSIICVWVCVWATMSLFVRLFVHTIFSGVP